MLRDGVTRAAPGAGATTSRPATATLTVVTRRPGRSATAATLLNGPVITVTLHLAAAGRHRGDGSRTSPAGGRAARGSRSSDRRRTPTPRSTVDDERGDAHLRRADGAGSRSSDGWRLDFLAGGRRAHRAAARKAHRHRRHRAGRRGHYVHEQLDLGVGEAVYGLGERFGPLVKNGQAVDIWNADGGTGSEQAYKNVPFYLTNRGYGVFVNHPGHGLVRGRLRGGRRACSSASPGESLEYFVIYGPDARRTSCASYTALTGRPALPPAWSFGLWLSTSFTTDYDEETVTGFIDGMAERDLPLSVFHFDCFWMREFHWCDFEWDPRDLPRPGGHAARGCTTRGLRICVWINPYIAQRSPLFAEGAAQRLPACSGPTATSGSGTCGRPGMAPGRLHQPGRAATGTQASCARCSTWASTASRPTSASASRPTWSGTTAPTRSGCTTTTPSSTTRPSSRCCAKRRGEGEAVLFARSATAGGQQFPVHWGGDCDVDLRVDGRDAARRAVARPVRLRLLEPRHRRLRGHAGPGRVQALDRVRAAVLAQPAARQPARTGCRGCSTRRRSTCCASSPSSSCRLMPYLFGAAVRGARATGMPVMRADGAGVPRRPGRARTSTGSTCSAPTCWSRRCSAPTATVDVLRAGGHAGRTCSPARRSTGPRWVRERHGFDSAAAAGPARRGAPGRRARRPAGLRLRATA